MSRSDDEEQAITALRGHPRRELLRMAAADALGLINPVETRRAVTAPPTS